MDSFFEKDYLTRLKVLNHLIYEESSLSDIEKSLHINYKTLKNTINQLEIDIKDAGLDQQIDIILSKKGKIYCKAKGVAFDRLGFYYLHHSFNYKVVEAFFFGDFNGVDNYANQQFISHTTAFRRIVNVKQILEDYGLSIKLVTGEFVGEESQKRFFFFFFYWYSYRFQHLLSSEVDWQKMENTVTNLFTLMGTPMAYHLKRKYMLIIAITLKRIKRKRFINYKDGQQVYEYLMKNSPKFPGFFKIMMQLFEEFGISDSATISIEITALYEVLFIDQNLLPKSELKLFKELYPQIVEDSHHLYSVSEIQFGKDKVLKYKDEIEDALFNSLFKSYRYYGDEEDFIPFYKKEYLRLPLYKVEEKKLRNIFEKELPDYAARDIRSQMLKTGMMYDSLHIQIRPTLEVAVLVMSHEYVVYYIKKKVEELFRERVSISLFLKEDTDIIISDVIDENWDKKIPVFTFVIGNENWEELISIVHKTILSKSYD